MSSFFSTLTAPISFACMTLLGLLTLLLGLRFLTSPTAASRDFGLHTPLTAQAATIKAARDLFTGTTILAFASLHDQRALGVCAAVGALVPGVDGWVAARSGGGWVWSRAVQHWVGVPAALGMAYFLLTT